MFLTEELIVFLCPMYNLSCGLSDYNMVRWKLRLEIGCTHSR